MKPEYRKAVEKWLRKDRASTRDQDCPFERIMNRRKASMDICWKWFPRVRREGQINNSFLCALVCPCTLYLTKYVAKVAKIKLKEEKNEN